MKKQEKIKMLRAVLYISLVILILLSFWPSLFNGFFCWDDKEVPLAPFVRQLTLAHIGKYFTTFHAGLYHPITTLSFAIDYAIGNGSALPFHITNLAFHIANSLLLLLFVNKLFRNMNLAVLVALMFGVHPMHVEAVAWITSRKDLLYTFFFLGSMLSYLKYLGGEKKKLFYLLSLLFFLLSCLSKIQGAILPAALFLVDYIRNRKLISGKTFRDKLAFLLIAVFLGVINIIAQKGYGYTNVKASFSIGERLVVFFYGFAQYLFRILLPWKVSVFYPFPFSPGEKLSCLFYLYPLAFLVFFSSLLLFIRREKRVLVFGFGFFFLCIFLVLMINNYRETVITDRYTYLGSAGIFVFLSSTGLNVFERMTKFKWLIPSMTIFYLLFLFCLTHQRARLWHSPERIIESALTLYPASPILLNTMGTLMIDSGHYENALGYLDRAIDADGKYAEAWYHKGMVENKLEHYTYALEDFTKAISLNPAFLDAYFGRGNVYRITGDNIKAMESYSMILIMDRNYFGAWQNRAIIKGNLNDFQGAIDDLDKAIGLDPGFGASYYLRGIAKFELKMDGCDDLKKALMLNYQPAQKALDFYCR